MHEREGKFQFRFFTLNLQNGAKTVRMYIYMYMYMYIYICEHVYVWYIHPWFVFSAWLLDIENISLIFQYKYWKSVPEVKILQDLILRTRLCGTGCITQHGQSFPPDLNGQPEMICTSEGPAPEGQIGGAGPEIFLHDS